MPKKIDKEKSLSIMRTLRVSQELDSKFKKYCFERNADYSDVIRQLMNAFVEKEINPIITFHKFKKEKNV